MELNGTPVYFSGYPGHFIGSEKCRFFLHTRVGDLRVSTIGDFCPMGDGVRREVDAGRFGETMIFRVDPDSVTPEGQISDMLGVARVAPGNGRCTRVLERTHHAIVEELAGALTGGRDLTDEEITEIAYGCLD